MNGVTNSTQPCDVETTSSSSLVRLPLVSDYMEPSVGPSSRSELPAEPAPARGLVAPVLRIEELKNSEDEGCLVQIGDGASAGSSINGTDDEALSGDASDQDGAGETPADGVEEQSSLAIGEFEIPSDDHKSRIIAQVEFYFSDANIVTDAFMLKHVRRNKQGYVSVKLITSFRKVKAMTKDYRIVAHCLRHSDKLEVNEEGTKVRRVAPLPAYDESRPTRTVIAVNLPTDKLTVESVAELFSAHGVVELVRILRPGKPLPSDLKRFHTKHPELGQSVCAVVEFESYEAAGSAAGASDTNNWRSGMRVSLLHNTTPTASGKKGAGKKGGAGRSEGGEGDSGGGIADEQRLAQGLGQGSGSWQGSGQRAQSNYSKESSLRSAELKKASRVEELVGGEGRLGVGGEGDAGSDSDSPQRRGGGAKIMRGTLSPQMDPTRLSPCQSPRSTPKSSPRPSPRSSPNSRRRSVGQSPLTVTDCASPAGGSPSQSPWVQRRLKAQLEGSPLSGSPGPASPSLARKSVPSGPGGEATGGLRLVLRQPRGPDGTRGFMGLRGSGGGAGQSAGEGTEFGENAESSGKESQQICLESAFSTS